MGYTNSSLVNCTVKSPNHSGTRTHAIDRITPHCVVGQLSAESIGGCFTSTDRQASCNYGIGKDGRVCLIVDEANRSWCSSSRANDQRAITIECASDSTEPYAFNTVVYNKLVELCIDICKRNGLTKVLWIEDKTTSLAYTPKTGECVLTVHRWFANKSCPGTWMYSRMAQLAADINAGLGSTTTTTATTDTSTKAPAGTTAEPKTIWDFLYGKIGNAFGVAGLMGNLYAESGLIPNNLQNTYNTKLGYTDAAYTEAVDNGTYTNFVEDSAGYGLAQWTYWSRKQALKDFADTKKASIGNLNMQLEFLYKELSESYAAVLTTLKNAKTVLEASNAILTKYEKPANQGSSVQTKRAGYGQTYYDKYAAADTTTTATTTTVTEQKSTTCTADAVIAVAVAEIGYKEKASNSQLDDKTANAGSANYTKYARDFDEKYPKWYNGKKNGYAWCDMFVDWCFLTAFGYEKALALLCQPEKSAGAGCTYSAGYFKAKGQFHTSGPQAGDQIFFGTSISSCSHTGIVEKVDSSKVYTIEGNTSDMVARRSYALNNSKIVGYGRPKYDGSTVQPATDTTTTTTTTSDDGSYTVYTVAKGDTLSSIAKKYGTTYQKLAEYNGISNPNVISVGQQIKIPSTGSSSTSTTAVTKKTATDGAASKLASLAGTYVTTANLNIRNGAGTSKAIMVTIPKGTSVKNYGYYTALNGVNWLYVQFTYNGITYTGFASSAYLQKQ